MHGYPSNCNNSKLRDVVVTHCGWHGSYTQNGYYLQRPGVYLQGGDANDCVFDGCRFDQNHGPGLIDDSFLGNDYYSLSLNLNDNNPQGAWGYDLLVNNPNANSLFMGTYIEGKGKAILNNRSLVISSRGGDWSQAGSPVINGGGRIQGPLVVDCENGDQLVLAPSGESRDGNTTFIAVRTTGEDGKARVLRLKRDTRFGLTVDQNNLGVRRSVIVDDDGQLSLPGLAVS